MEECDGLIIYALNFLLSFSFFLYIHWIYISITKQEKQLFLTVLSLFKRSLIRFKYLTLQWLMLFVFTMVFGKALNLLAIFSRHTHSSGNQSVFFFQHSGGRFKSVILKQANSIILSSLFRSFSVCNNLWLVLLTDITLVFVFLSKQCLWKGFASNYET